jgi:hypothetical protein
VLVHVHIAVLDIRFPTLYGAPLPPYRTLMFRFQLVCLILAVLIAKANADTSQSTRTQTSSSFTKGTWLVQDQGSRSSLSSGKKHAPCPQPRVVHAARSGNFCLPLPDIIAPEERSVITGFSQVRETAEANKVSMQLYSTDSSPVSGTGT